MQIIEHGDPAKFNPTVMFKCCNCGCKFKADRTEYRKKTLLDASILGASFYYCDCPECGEVADDFTEEGEEK